MMAGIFILLIVIYIMVPAKEHNHNLSKFGSLRRKR